MKAIWNDQVIAESDDTVFVEGRYYFPMSAVRDSYLEDSDTKAVTWKGIANYYHLIVDGVQNENAAWTYNDPKEAAQKLTGRIAFWRGVEVIA